MAKHRRRFDLGPGVRAILKEVRVESDRSKALTYGAVVDDMVLSIVRKRLRSSMTAPCALFDGPAAPLGTAFARNTLLFELGVISEHQYTDLETIRRIRNVFAHEWSVSSFEHQKVSGLLDNLEPPNIEPQRVEERKRRRKRFGLPPTSTELMNTSAARFAYAVVGILIQLVAVRKASTKPKRISEKGPRLSYRAMMEAMEDVAEAEKAGVTFLPPRKRARRSRQNR